MSDRRSALWSCRPLRHGVSGPSRPSALNQRGPVDAHQRDQSPEHHHLQRDRPWRRECRSEGGAQARLRSGGGADVERVGEQAAGQERSRQRQESDAQQTRGHEQLRRRQGREQEETETSPRATATGLKLLAERIDAAATVLGDVTADATARGREHQAPGGGAKCSEQHEGYSGHIKPQAEEDEHRPSRRSECRHHVDAEHHGRQQGEVRQAQRRHQRKWRGRARRVCQLGSFRDRRPWPTARHPDLLRTDAGENYGDRVAPKRLWQSPEVSTEIPFHQDGPGCKLWFRRAELDSWRWGTFCRPFLYSAPDRI